MLCESPSAQLLPQQSIGFGKSDLKIVRWWVGKKMYSDESAESPRNAVGATVAIWFPYKCRVSKEVSILKTLALTNESWFA
jgi:hypothetical protein